MLRTSVLLPLALVALAAPAAVAVEHRPAETLGNTATSRVLFNFKDDRIVESSGIETSVRHPRITFTHNDSGDDSRFFAVGPNGQTRAVYTLDGAGHSDWEDMSAGPHKTLWFGDVGDNAARRDSIQLYRVREPKKMHSRKIAYTRYDFEYSDGAHNCEALMVNPVNGQIYVITKQDSDAAIYKARRPLTTSGTNVLRRVASINLTGRVTGADFTANGKRFVLRTYGVAYFYRNIGGRVLFDFPMPSSGESIAFARTGKGVIVSQEGAHTPVYRSVRQQG